VEAAIAAFDGVPFPAEVPLTWTPTELEWDAAARTVHEHHVVRLTSRLEVVEGVRRGLDLGDRLHELVRRSADRDAAVRALAGLGFTEVVAQHLLELRVGQQTALGQADLDAEAAALRAELERLSPPGRAGGRRT
jgi:DNA gyrase/topoisomerase IV subunit A